MCAFIRKLTGLLSTFLLSIFTVFLILLMAFSEINFAINKFNNQDQVALLIAIGAAIATILAIAFSLSIIPIQKASEAWTPAILEIYKKDRKTHISIIIVCLMIVITFFLAILEPNKVWPINFGFIAVFFFAVTLDILRYYYKHICSLLDPIEVIYLARNRAIGIINRNST